eukprot:gene22094-13940_t
MPSPDTDALVAGPHTAGTLSSPTDDTPTLSSSCSSRRARQIAAAMAADSADASHTCNVCRTGGIRDGAVYRCTWCDYDLCPACRAKREMAIGRAPAGGAGNMVAAKGGGRESPRDGVATPKGSAVTEEWLLRALVTQHLTAGQSFPTTMVRGALPAARHGADVGTLGALAPLAFLPHVVFADRAAYMDQARYDAALRAAGVRESETHDIGTVAACDGRLLPQREWQDPPAADFPLTCAFRPNSNSNSNDAAGGDAAGGAATPPGK